MAQARINKLYETKDQKYTVGELGKKVVLFTGNQVIELSEVKGELNITGKAAKQAEALK